MPATSVIFIILAAAIYILFRFAVGSLRGLRYRVERDVPSGYTVEELVAMRNQGLLTEEEFQKAAQSVMTKRNSPRQVPFPPVEIPEPTSRQRGFEVLPPKK